jgi:RNA polymerase sigma-70 factor (ECF subfamily)
LSATNSFFPPAAAYPAAEVERQSAPAKLHPDDEALMARIQKGEEQALGMLLERYGSIVLAIGLKVLRDREEAQELVQDVFFQVFRKRDLYDPGKGAARAWLMQTAYHRAFDRREYLQLRGFYDRKNVEDLIEIMQASSNVEREAQIHQRGTILRQAFEDLSQKQKLTLTLFFFEGYTLREISEQIKEPLPNVRHHYYRGLKTLKEHLGLNPLKGGSLQHGF